jgi:hypothetical protein
MRSRVPLRYLSEVLRLVIVYCNRNFGAVSGDHGLIV